MSRRILLLTTDLEIGGTPTVVRELAARLRARADVHIEVVALGRWGPVATQTQDAGVRVRALGANGIFQLPNVVWKVARIVRREHFDTVLSFLVHANVVAAIASLFTPGVRFLQSIQTTQPDPSWHWWLQRIAQHAAERIVVPSPSVSQVAQSWADVPPGKIVIIPNAIDLKDFAASAAGERGGARVGFIGRLDPVKRIPDLLHAMASMDDHFHLHIFGDGAQRDHLKRLIDMLGITRRVWMHGAIARPQDALAQIDMLVLPSQAEGFGLVLIEAMAAGVPVVATDVAGICDVVRHDETGILVPVASPQALAAAIHRVAGDSRLRARLVENACRDVAARFTWEVVLPLYLDLLGIGQFTSGVTAPPPLDFVAFNSEHRHDREDLQSL